MSVWTATIVGLTSAGNVEEASVVLANDAGVKFQQSFHTDGTVDDLTRQVIATTIAQDNKIHKSDLKLGPLDLTATNPAVPDPLVVQFQADLSALRREERALAEGLVTGNDVSALRKTVQDHLTQTASLGALL